MIFLSSSFSLIGSAVLSRSPPSGNSRYASSCSSKPGILGSGPFDVALSQSFTVLCDIPSASPIISWSLALLGTAFPLNSPVFLIRLSTVLYFALSNFIISLPPFSLIRDFIIQYLFLLKRVTAASANILHTTVTLFRGCYFYILQLHQIYFFWSFSVLRYPFTIAWSGNPGSTDALRLCSLS